MLTPQKHHNLDRSVLRVSALMLRELQRRSVVEFEKLRRYVIRRAGSDADVTFLPLSLLFLLGKVEYHIQNDTIDTRFAEKCKSAESTLTIPMFLRQSTLIAGTNHRDSMSSK